MARERDGYDATTHISSGLLQSDHLIAVGRSEYAKGEEDAAVFTEIGNLIQYFFQHPYQVTSPTDTSKHGSHWRVVSWAHFNSLSDTHGYAAFRQEPGDSKITKIKIDREIWDEDEDSYSSQEGVFDSIQVKDVILVFEWDSKDSLAPTIKEQFTVNSIQQNGEVYELTVTERASGGLDNLPTGVTRYEYYGNAGDAVISTMRFANTTHSGQHGETPVNLLKVPVSTLRGAFLQTTFEGEVSVAWGGVAAEREEWNEEEFTAVATNGPNNPAAGVFLQAVPGSDTEAYLYFSTHNLGGHTEHMLDDADVGDEFRIAGYEFEVTTATVTQHQQHKFPRRAGITFDSADDRTAAIALRGTVKMDERTIKGTFAEPRFITRSDFLEKRKWHNAHILNRDEMIQEIDREKWADLGTWTRRNDFAESDGEYYAKIDTTDSKRAHIVFAGKTAAGVVAAAIAALDKNTAHRRRIWFGGFYADLKGESSLTVAHEVSETYTLRNDWTAANGQVRVTKWRRSKWADTVNNSYAKANGRVKMDLGSGNDIWIRYGADADGNSSNDLYNAGHNETLRIGGYAVTAYNNINVAPGSPGDFTRRLTVTAASHADKIAIISLTSYDIERKIPISNRFAVHYENNSSGSDDTRLKEAEVSDQIKLGGKTLTVHSNGEDGVSTASEFERVMLVDAASSADETAVLALTGSQAFTFILPTLDHDYEFEFETEQDCEDFLDIGVGHTAKLWCANGVDEDELHARRQKQVDYNQEKEWEDDFLKNRHEIMHRGGSNLQVEGTHVAGMELELAPDQGVEAKLPSPHRNDSGTLDRQAPRCPAVFHLGPKPVDINTTRVPLQISLLHDDTDLKSPRTYAEVFTTDVGDSGEHAVNKLIIQTKEGTEEDKFLDFMEVGCVLGLDLLDSAHPTAKWIWAHVKSITRGDPSELHGTGLGVRDWTVEISVDAANSKHSTTLDNAGDDADTFHIYLHRTALAGPSEWKGGTTERKAPTVRQVRGAIDSEASIMWKWDGTTNPTVAVQKGSPAVQVGQGASPYVAADRYWKISQGAGSANQAGLRATDKNVHWPLSEFVVEIDHNDRNWSILLAAGCDGFPTTPGDSGIKGMGYWIGRSEDDADTKSYFSPTNPGWRMFPFMNRDGSGAFNGLASGAVTIIDGTNATEYTAKGWERGFKLPNWYGNKSQWRFVRYYGLLRVYVNGTHICDMDLGADWNVGGDGDTPDFGPGGDNGNRVSSDFRIYKMTAGQPPASALTDKLTATGLLLPSTFAKGDLLGAPGDGKVVPERILKIKPEQVPDNSINDGHVHDDLRLPRTNLARPVAMEDSGTSHNQHVGVATTPSASNPDTFAKVTNQADFKTWTAYLNESQWDTFLTDSVNHYLRIRFGTLSEVSGGGGVIEGYFRLDKLEKGAKVGSHRPYTLTGLLHTTHGHHRAVITNVSKYLGFDRFADNQILGRPDLSVRDPEDHRSVIGLLASQFVKGRATQIDGNGLFDVIYSAGSRSSSTNLVGSTTRTLSGSHKFNDYHFIIVEFGRKDPVVNQPFRQWVGCILGTHAFPSDSDAVGGFWTTNKETEGFAPGTPNPTLGNSHRQLQITGPAKFVVPEVNHEYIRVYGVIKKR